MVIRPKFTPGEIAKMIGGQVGKIEEAILRRLKFVGEKFVTNARNNHTYKDRTGNLTASIGYVILKDGVTVYENFKGNSEGNRKARQTVEDVKSGFLRGFVLIVVAGMEYAAAVESRNLDVLTASSIIAETDLTNAINEIKSKIGRLK